MMSLQLSKETLTELYLQKSLSIWQIEKETGIHRATVHRLLKFYAIPRRPAGQRPKLAISDLGKIKRMYLEEKLSATQIAEYLGYTRMTILRRLHELGIARSLSESLKNSYETGRKRSKSGAESPRWKGGIKECRQYRYVYKPEHPRADKHGYIAEHILIWEETHQKALPKSYIVHHINGIKKDNRPENLIALRQDKHEKIIPEMAKRIRALEIENRQFRKALEDSQMIFYISEN